MAQEQTPGKQNKNTNIKNQGTSNSSGGRGASAELAARARTYIDEHYTEKFSLDGLAAALFVNKIYLSKSFKKATGETLLGYHNRKRCEEACRLLRTTDLNAEIIGSRVGYVTPSHFARVFKSIYGISPTAYRKTSRSDSDQ